MPKKILKIHNETVCSWQIGQGWPSYAGVVAPPVNGLGLPAYLVISFSCTSNLRLILFWKKIGFNFSNIKRVITIELGGLCNISNYRSSRWRCCGFGQFCFNYILKIIQCWKARQTSIVKKTRPITGRLWRSCLYYGQKSYLRNLRFVVHLPRSIKPALVLNVTNL